MKIKNNLKKTIIPLIVFLLLIFILLNYLSWQKNYQNKLSPGVRIGNIDLSGKTYAETKEIITNKAKEIETGGISIKHDDKTNIISLNSFSFDSDLAYPSLSFDIEKTLNGLFNNKKNTSFLSYLYYKFTPFKPSSVKVLYTLNEEKIRNALKESFPELEIPAANAYFSLDAKDNNKQIKAEPEKIGKQINYEQFFLDLNSSLEILSGETILIKTQSKYPSVKQEDLAEIETEAQKLIGQDKITFTFNDLNVTPNKLRSWEIGNDILISWISAQKENNKMILSLDKEKIAAYLEKTISPDINQEIITPRFEMKGGRVNSWQTGKNGRELDTKSSSEKITENILKQTYSIELIVKELPAETTTAENNFQIKEILGTGHSNFSGSPKNRQHNIRVGANSVHGLLIKPGEEFSLVKNLGAIDETSDYLPELVIKGNKTIPEYGGGLCQIGTTIFRAALASGLPISARQNHSYRVSYYEPAGTDAAVYDPWPDVRFINDTGNYILIQSRISGNDIYFDFWGVKDGRIATTTKPTIYNIVKPEATKIIETDSLKPGEKKCTESAHNGADAYFDYKVIYPEGATTTPIQERRFSSHYVPWTAVCLIGKTATTATSTDSSLPNTETASSSATSTTIITPIVTPSSTPPVASSTTP